MRPRFPRWLKLVLFQAVVLAGFGVLLECASRLFFAGVADRVVEPLVPTRVAVEKGPPAEPASVSGTAGCECRDAAECRLGFPLRDQRLPCRKAAGATRILFLGESSVWGDRLRADETFPARVEQIAAGRGLAVEAINGGVSGGDLRRALEVLRFLAPRLHPDVVIVYAGHNEVFPLMWYDGGAMMRTLRGEDRYARVYRWSSFVRLSAHVARRLLWRWDNLKGNVDPEDCHRTHGDLILDAARLAEIKAFRPRAWEQSRTRLGWVLDYSRQAGAKVIYIAPTGNRLLPPASPAHGPGYLARRAAWEAQWAVADGQLKEGRWDRAKDSLVALADLDPDHAPTYYWLGMASLQLGDSAGARAWFDRCLETVYLYRPVCHSLDGAPPSLVSVLVGAARERGVPTWDGDEAVRGGAGPENDRKLFVDRIHLSAYGAKVFAERLVDRLLREGWIGPGSAPPGGRPPAER